LLLLLLVLALDYVVARAVEEDANDAEKEGVSWQTAQMQQLNHMHTKKKPELVMKIDGKHAT
jgi:hypothetical protein